MERTRVKTERVRRWERVRRRGVMGAIFLFLFEERLYVYFTSGEFVEGSGFQRREVLG
jgi:hypothetical protein